MKALDALADVIREPNGEARLKKYKAWKADWIETLEHLSYTDLLEADYRKARDRVALVKMASAIVNEGRDFQVVQLEDLGKVEHEGKVDFCTHLAIYMLRGEPK
jgi:hypothetical protein